MTRNITAMRAAGASGGLVVDDIMRARVYRLAQPRKDHFSRRGFNYEMELEKWRRLSAE